MSFHLYTVNVSLISWSVYSHDQGLTTVSFQGKIYETSSGKRFRNSGQNVCEPFMIGVSSHVTHPTEPVPTYSMHEYESSSEIAVH